LGDINYFLEQRNLENMREVEKKMSRKLFPKESNKASYEDQKVSHCRIGWVIESQIKQLEKDIQNDDKMLASNYNKHIEDAF
jgi:ATP-binding cassette subfamily F protein 3